MDNPLVQPDPGLFIWTILTFLVLVALLAKFAWGPLLKALEERQESIRKSLDEAQRARVELEQVQQESARIVAQARVEAEDVISRSRADAERLREDLKQKARSEAEGIVKNAERQIQLETARAVRPIRNEAIDLAVMIASKVLQRKISKEDNERLIEEALAQVEGQRQH